LGVSGSLRPIFSVSSIKFTTPRLDFTNLYLRSTRFEDQCDRTMVNPVA